MTQPDPAFRKVSSGSGGRVIAELMVGGLLIDVLQRSPREPQER
jgi:hypothetical protein